MREDLRDVIADMQSAGHGMDEAWFAPHYEFRFPRYGAVRYREVELELRQALEPWHVLGEEGAVGGTVRYVDSSVERLQVRATGMSGDRYAIACNGREIPMRETGVSGEQVAGVRYRAWKPESSLHPSIGADAPLVFDITIDGPGARLAVAPITSSIRAAATTRPFQSTPMRQRAGASPGSLPTATRRARVPPRARPHVRNFPIRSTCIGPSLRHCPHPALREHAQCLTLLSAMD